MHGMCLPCRALQHTQIMGTSPMRSSFWAMASCWKTTLQTSSTSALALSHRQSKVSSLFRWTLPQEAFRLPQRHEESNPQGTHLGVFANVHGHEANARHIAAYPSRSHEKVQGIASVSYCHGSRTENGLEGPPSGA